MHASGGNKKDSRWTVAEDTDGSSQRGILDEEMGLRSPGRTLHSQDGDLGIIQTSTVTVTIESDAVPACKERTFFDFSR